MPTNVIDIEDYRVAHGIGDPESLPEITMQTEVFSEATRISFTEPGGHKRQVWIENRGGSPVLVVAADPEGDATMVIDFPSEDGARVSSATTEDAYQFSPSACQRAPHSVKEALKSDT